MSALRTQPRRRGRRILTQLAVSAGLLLGLCTIGATATAQESVPASPAANAAEKAEERAKQDWQRRYQTALFRVRAAERRYEEAMAAYSRGRNRQRLRGNLKVEVLEELEASKRQLLKARAEVELVPEEARRAGVPPGWLREVEDSFGEGA